MSPAAGFEDFAAMAAELPGRAARNAERFVNHRMIVHKRINTVAPLAVAPAVGGEQFFNRFFRTAGAIDRDRAFVNENRQRRIVRHLSVILEFEAQRRVWH